MSNKSDINRPGSLIFNNQTVSCEIKFAHAHVRAHSHVCDVRAKRLSKCACDVRACGRFGCATCDCIFALFWVKKGPNYGRFWVKFA